MSVDMKHNVVLHCNNNICTAVLVTLNLPTCCKLALLGSVMPIHLK